MAEKKKNRIKEIMPNIILIFVLICSVLIIMEVSTPIAVEFETFNEQEEIQSTIINNSEPTPTFSPDVTLTTNGE